MKAPTIQLPRVIHISMGLVLVLYIIANLSYLIVLPTDAIASSNTVALDFGKTVLGPVGGLIFALLVACSCLGMLNGDMYTSSRLVAEAGAEGFLPRVFAQYHEKRHTPMYAVLLQGGLTCILVLWGDFKSLIVFSSVCAFVWYLTMCASFLQSSERLVLTCSFDSIGALLLLRVREPDLSRPYKTWITTPIAFACVSFFLLSVSQTAHPLCCLDADDVARRCHYRPHRWKRWQHFCSSCQECQSTSSLSTTDMRESGSEDSLRAGASKGTSRRLQQRTCR